MPDYKGHLVGAFAFLGLSLAALGCAGYYLKPIVVAQGLFFVFLGALFPDIDTKSKGQRLFYAVMFVAMMGLLIYQKYLAGLALAILGFFPLFVKHRALFHKFWFATMLVVAAVLGCALYWPAYTNAGIRNGLFFLVGILSHLVLDFGVRGLLKR